MFIITHFSTRKIQVQNILCTKIVCFGIQNNVCTQHVLNLYFSCTEVSNQWKRNGRIWSIFDVHIKVILKNSKLANFKTYIDLIKTFYKNAIWHSNKVRFDAEVAEKFINGICSRRIVTYFIWLRLSQDSGTLWLHS